MSEEVREEKTLKERANDTAEGVGIAAKKIGSTVARVGSAAMDTGGAAVKKTKDAVVSASNIRIEDVLYQAMKLPLVKIDRGKFLKKELIKYYPTEIVELAIEKNPAYAGIDREKINDIANQVINYETNKVSAISFASGMPGGVAMAATIPADLSQYFGFMIRVMQKLAYLYGFGAFNFNEEEVSDETMNQMLIFMGIMFGVQTANSGVKAIASAATVQVSKTLARQPLTKTATYQIVKSVSRTVGVRMTKQIFAKSVSKVVPVLGGIVSGGITYATFKPCSCKLQKSLQKLNLSDPVFYRQSQEMI